MSALEETVTLADPMVERGESCMWFGSALVGVAIVAGAWCHGPARRAVGGE